MASLKFVNCHNSTIKVSDGMVWVEMKASLQFGYANGYGKSREVWVFSSE